jgi:dihydroxyacetone kinase phosphotransfer subunit
MQMASENEHIVAAGGMEDGSIGTDAFRIMAAIEKADDGDGVAVLADLGSGIMSAEMAIEMLDEDIEVRIADAPVLEGAVSAAVTSTSGASLDEVIEAAEEARTASKLN